MTCSIQLASFGGVAGTQLQHVQCVKDQSNVNVIPCDLSHLESGDVPEHHVSIDLYDIA